MEAISFSCNGLGIFPPVMSLIRRVASLASDMPFQDMPLPDLSDHQFYVLTMAEALRALAQIDDVCTASGLKVDAAGLVFFV